MQEVKSDIYKRYIKRFLDIVISFMMLLLLSPLLLIIAAFVRILIGPMIIFKQNRPGLKEKVFTLYKFRTMTMQKDKTGTLLSDDKRLTRFGKFLRGSSIDELPELLNILKGDMSIVGPRPLLEQYLPLYNEWQKRRHECKPGLTGLAQINGRNSISWEDKFKLDINYIDHITLIGDIKIILQTIIKVFKREGIHSTSAATMEVFKGNLMEVIEDETKDDETKANEINMNEIKQDEIIEKEENRNQLLIIGASGHGKVVADIALKMKHWKYIAFLDDNTALKTSMGLEVIGGSRDALQCIKEYELFVAIGNNTIRKNLLTELEHAGACIATLIHPSCVIGELVDIGVGTVVMAGTVINCCSRIGKGCIINTGATVDHDNVIEDYAHISPGVHTAGTVMIGKGTWLGIGSTIKNNLQIIDGCIIGAGAVVVEDITEVGTYVGVPAKKIQT